MLTDESSKDTILAAFDTLLKNSPDLIFYKDMQLVYLASSDVFARLVGHASGAELVGKNDCDLFPEALAERYTHDDREVLLSGVSLINKVEPLPKMDGYKSYSSTSKYIVRDAQGQTIGLLGVGRDVTATVELTEERVRSAQLEIQAETDPLTGLPNRNAIMSRVESCITGAGSQQQHALLFIDLDCFKHVNDTLGHPYGDRILQEIANRLLGLCGDNVLVGRTGGDEFLLLLQNVQSREAVEQQAEVICRTLPLHLFENGQDFSVTCSVGISLYSSGKTLQTLYEEADKAMYFAKGKGRNGIAFFE